MSPAAIWLRADPIAYSYRGRTAHRVEAFEHLSPEECRDFSSPFWEEVIDPPFEPFYCTPQLNVDPSQTTPFTPAEALFLLTESFVMACEDAERKYRRANYYIHIGQMSFDDEKIAAYTRIREQARRDYERLMLWPRMALYGAPREKWEGRYRDFQLMLDGLSFDHRFTGLRVRDLLDELVEKGIPT